MHAFVRDGVRAFLPAIAMAVCHGCGGGSSEMAAAVTPPRAGDQAPTISGQPAGQAKVGVAYSFQPNVVAAAGDALTFSVDNLPPWAHFDTASGRITGTPAASDVGEYEAITITVADAAHRTVSSPFTITVSGAVSVATLHWARPQSKLDGSPLDDLAGYHIIYGRNPDNLDHSVFIDGADRTSFEFTTLSAGAWYFAVIGVRANGLEGPPTTPAEKSI